MTVSRTSFITPRTSSDPKTTRSGRGQRVEQRELGADLRGDAGPRDLDRPAVLDAWTCAVGVTAMTSFCLPNGSTTASQAPSSSARTCARIASGTAASSTTRA